MFTMMNKEKTTKKQRNREIKRHSKREEELYDRRIIRGTPTLRPVKKSSLKQIF